MFRSWKSLPFFVTAWTKAERRVEVASSSLRRGEKHQWLSVWEGWRRRRKERSGAVPNNANLVLSNKQTNPKNFVNVFVPAPLHKNPLSPNVFLALTPPFCVTLSFLFYYLGQTYSSKSPLTFFHVLKTFLFILLIFFITLFLLSKNNNILTFCIEFY